jgi:predicted glycosyltransferase
MTSNQRALRVLVDVAHPAHALRYAPIADGLQSRGVETLIVGREKDVTRQILEASGLPFVMLPTGRQRERSGTNRGRLVGELVRRVKGLRFVIRDFEPGAVLTSNPSGAIAGRSIGVPAIFDTVDGTAVGAHHSLSEPFADVVTSPVSVGEDLGRKHIAYRSFKSLAWLHPSRFQPSDRELLVAEGMPSGPFCLLRVVAHSASHDRGVAGLSDDMIAAVLERCHARGLEVVISAEVETPVIKTSPLLSTHPEAMSSVLSYASLVATDSASVAEEASMLGVPAYRICTPLGRRSYLDHLEERYGLGRNFMVSESSRFLQEVDSAARDHEALRSAAMSARQVLLEEHHDGVDWYIDLVSRVATFKKRSRSTIVEELRRAGLDERSCPSMQG